MADQGRRGSSQIRRARKLAKRLGRGAKHARTIMREGRLGAPYSWPFDVVESGEVHALRHYVDAEATETGEARPAALLVPPLMVASEVYDISPELSAVAQLMASEIDVWLCDFGAPEHADGGMTRTLDDHVLAVVDSIETVARETGGPVHIIGYSQGGMFCYQAAAFRKSKDVASIVTFGSPVDIRRILPKVHEDVAGRVLRAARALISRPLDQLSGLPSSITSTGFKLLSPKKEVDQLVKFFNLLDDREALEQREPRRKFLGGDGFVAWPGPAFKKFVDDMIVDNRLASGGLVIDGRAVSLADITAPILYFVGSRDDIARPPAVKAIEGLVVNAETTQVELDAGHFGLVVGSRAVGVSWPTVASWIHADGALEEPSEAVEERAEVEEYDSRSGLLYDMGTRLVDRLWHRLGDASLEVSRAVDLMRWQVPRLARLESLQPRHRVSVGRALAEQADAIGDEVFFLWKERGFTYRQANRRVNQVVHVLLRWGVSPGDQVGVLMEDGANLLTALVALNRLGAVGVVIPRSMSPASAHSTAPFTRLVTDAAQLEACDVDVPVAAFAAADSALPADVLDIKASLDHDIEFAPPELDADAGAAEDLAFILFTSGTTGAPKGVRVSNGRWALAALGSAALCQLTSHDTVYCALPLSHASGLLLGSSGALVGGARLALGRRFSTETFWDDVARCGATVVMHVGEMARRIADADAEPRARHQVRLFAGSGARPRVWNELVERFGPVRILELYASTEGNAFIVNVSGDKPGSVGQPFPLGGELALVRHQAGEFVREDGRCVRCAVDEPGVLLARLGDGVMGEFDGFVDDADTEAHIVRGAFERDDAWFDTRDVFRRDAEGDYWFVDRLRDHVDGASVSTAEVADALRQLDFVVDAVVFVDDRELRAAVELVAGADFDRSAIDAAIGRLPEAARPRAIDVVDEIIDGHSFRPSIERLGF